ANQCDIVSIDESFRSAEVADLAILAHFEKANAENVINVLIGISNASQRCERLHASHLSECSHLCRLTGSESVEIKRICSLSLSALLICIVFDNEKLAMQASCYTGLCECKSECYRSRFQHFNYCTLQCG